MRQDVEAEGTPAEPQFVRESLDQLKALTAA
jgi:hypothetical protein